MKTQGDLINEEDMEKEDKTEKLWDLFDKLTDAKKIEWLLEFDIIRETVKVWDDEIIDEEIKRLKEWVNEIPEPMPEGHIEDGETGEEHYEK